MSNFELRWLKRKVDTVLQYRVKYDKTMWPASPGVTDSLPYTEKVWSEWTDVKEVLETKENK